MLLSLCYCLLLLVASICVVRLCRVKDNSKYRLLGCDLCVLVHRLWGHVAFRNNMLGQYGHVVTVSYKSNPGSMAGDIRAAVEAKTGLPLDCFCS